MALRKRLTHSSSEEDVSGSWDEWKRVVLSKMDHLSASDEELTASITSIKETLLIMKTRGALVGGLFGGVLGAAIHLLINVLSAKMGK